MIEVPCLDQDKYTNPYQIQKILLEEEANKLTMILVCKEQKVANTLWSAIDRYRVVMKDDMVNKKVPFSFDKEVWVTGSEYRVVLKGNLVSAVNALIERGILDGKNKAIFHDQEEEAIQAFLKRSVKQASLSLKQEENNPDLPSKGRSCTLF